MSPHPLSKVCKNKKIGPVTVSRPRLYARTPPIQNLGETEVAWEKMYFFFVFLRDTTAQSPAYLTDPFSYAPSFLLRNKCYISIIDGDSALSPAKISLWKFVEISTDGRTHLLSDIPPIEATAEGVA